MNDLFRQEIYKDKWLFLLGIPMIVLLIQHVGLSWEVIKEYVQEDYYWNNLLFNLFVTTLAFFFNRNLILWLDHRVPYRPNLRKRISLQILLSLISILIVTEIITYLYVKVWAKADYWETRFSTDLPVIIILILLLNLIYIGFFLQYDAKKTANIFLSEEQPSSILPLPPPQLEASLGNKKILLEHQQIVLFFSKDKITQAVTLEGKRYFMNQSLKQVYELLNAPNFFQANRQIIINRSAIKGYRKLPNRKLELILISDDFFMKPIYVSKEKSPVFLKWLEKCVVR